MCRRNWRIRPVDAGANLVLGYGPDNRLRTEQYHDGYIVYALGDVFGEESAILRATFTAAGMQPPQLLLTTAAAAQPQLLAQADGSVARVTDFPAADVVGADPVIAGDVPHYNIDVSLTYDAHVADVSQTVTLLNDSGDGWAEVVFHAAPAYWGDMLQLSGVWLTLDGAEETAVYELQETMLHVQLPRLLLPGEALAVAFAYRLNLPRLDPTGWGPEGNAGWGPDLIQMGDWYPALIPYEDGAGWRTWTYWPVGDPVISRLADFAVTVRVPAPVTVVAPGLVAQDGDAWQYQLAGARAFAFLASPNYVRFSGDAGGIPVEVSVTQAYQAVGPVVLQTAVQALTLFNDLYGPYPYDSFVMAENGFLTAMEYSGIVSLSGYAFDSYNGSADSLLVAIIAHEVAHQWWYGGVGNDQIYEPWLDEGLAMISELLFYERYYPDLLDWWWQFRVTRWEPGGPVDATIYDYSTSESFVHNMYGQAAYFMADLRDWMGDAAFRQFLQTYYRQYRDGFATGTDFFAAAQAETAVDLTPLIAQYFQQE
ncbi:MAG: M1 family metallopeptidase [Chloroflexota bacterium]